MVGEAGRIELLTAEEVARLLRVAEQTLAQWRCAGSGPNYIKIGGLVRYEASAIEDYIKENRNG